MNVATLARAWFDHHDFSTLPPSGDGSYDPQRPLRLYSLNGIAVKQPFVVPAFSRNHSMPPKGGTTNGALNRLSDFPVSLASPMDRSVAAQGVCRKDLGPPDAGTKKVLQPSAGQPRCRRVEPSLKTGWREMKDSSSQIRWFRTGRRQS